MIEESTVRKGLKYLVPRMYDCGVEDFIIIGGASLLLQGLDVKTNDVDIVVIRYSTSSLRKLHTKLKRDNIYTSYGGDRQIGYIVDAKIEDVLYLLMTPEVVGVYDDGSSFIDLDGYKVKVKSMQAVCERYMEMLNEKDASGNLRWEGKHRKKFIKRIKLIETFLKGENT